MHLFGAKWYFSELIFVNKYIKSTHSEISALKLHIHVHMCIFKNNLDVYQKLLSVIHNAIYNLMNAFFFFFTIKKSDLNFYI